MDFGNDLQQYGNTTAYIWPIFGHHGRLSEEGVITWILANWKSNIHHIHRYVSFHSTKMTMKAR